MRQNLVDYVEGAEDMLGHSEMESLVKSDKIRLLELQNETPTES